MGFAMPVWIRNYFSDFICLFLINGSILYLLKFIKKDKNLELTIAQVAVSWVLCSLCFEYVLPRTQPNVYTQDYLDILMYALGAVMFILWRGKPKLF